MHNDSLMINQSCFNDVDELGEETFSFEEELQTFPFPEDILEKDNFAKIDTIEEEAAKIFDAKIKILTQKKWKNFSDEKQNVARKRLQTNPRYIEVIIPEIIIWNKTRTAVPLICQFPALKIKAPEVYAAITHLIKVVVVDQSLNRRQAKIIFRHFVEPIKAIVQNRQINMDEVSATKAKLNKRVHHMPKRSRLLIIAMAAVISAILTFAFFSAIIGAFILTTGMVVPLLLPAYIATVSSLAMGIAGGCAGDKISSGYKVKPELDESYKEAFTHAAQVTFWRLFNKKSPKPVKQPEIRNSLPLII